MKGWIPMTETVTYAPVPEPRPRIGRDWTAVVLAVVAVLPIYLGMPLFEWLQGRLNVESELPFMGTSCLAMLAYPIASIALLIRVLIRFLDGTAMQRVRWILLLALLPLPCLALVSGIAPPSLFDGYTGGFASWTRANVDAKAIRQWAATVAPDARTGIERPDYWLGGPMPGISFVPVVKADWPACIARAKPKEAYVLSDRSAVILHWPTGHAGWARTIVVTADETRAPPQWWPFRDLGQGVWACVRGPA